MSRLLKITAILLISSAICGYGQGKSDKPYKVGVMQRAYKPPEPYNWRGADTHALVTTIWYPADPASIEQPQWIGPPENAFVSLGNSAPDAKLAPSPARFPLIVISHGTGGSAAMMAWLGTALAAHGFIAAAVNHPGNNATEPYKPQGFILWWERAHDLSVLIDSVLADPTLGARVDQSRIGGAGFSLGGYTMIEIAGGITQVSLYKDFCSSPQADGSCVPPPEFPDLARWADEVPKSDAQAAESMRHESDSYRDPRVRAVFAIAPALGPAFQPQSLRKISIPVEIVAGTADKNVPIGSSAQFFAREIPHARLTLLPQVGHYTFLATCGPSGKNSRPDLCGDGAGIDRDSIHAKVAQMAVDFFKAKLKITSGQATRFDF